MGPAGKVRTVSWQMEQVVDELPLFLLRLEEFSNLVDERMDFGTFKFCFVVMATFLVSNEHTFKSRGSFFIFLFN